jgi:hypothetical protein
VVPTSYFSAQRTNQISAYVYVGDNKLDRVVVQLKEIQYRTSSVYIDPKPQVKTVALVDTAFDPFFFMDNVPGGQFVLLMSDLFSLIPSKGINITDPPFEGVQFVQYYIEVMLITKRQPPLVTLPTPEIRGPALASVQVCPRFDENTCFFQEPNFNSLPFCIRGNESIPALDPLWDNKISSLRVAPGGMLLVCELPNFRGWCEIYSGEVRQLPSNRDKAISSLMRFR